MYVCQLMVPCVDSASKSGKSSPRLGAAGNSRGGVEWVQTTGAALVGAPIEPCGSRAPRQKIVWSWGGSSSGRHAELGVKHVLSKFTFLRVDFRKAELYAQSSGHLYLQAVLPTERLPFFIGSVAVLCPVTSQPPPLPQPCRRRRLGRTAMPNYRPQSAAVSGTTRTNTIRPQSAPLPKATQPKLISRAELDEISQKMFDRAAAYAARRDKLHDDHVEKINGWKLRVEIRPAVYGGKERFKYMSEASKSALAEACWLPLNHPREPLRRPVADQLRVPGTASRVRSTGTHL